MRSISLTISPENKIREEHVFEEIAECISARKSIVFDAGAGAGKTYSLVQSLNYIVNKFGKFVKKNNQKILCITFTNVAVAEIKGRLGHTSLIEVSTIHDCVWGIIEPYQKQLVRIHRNKMQADVDETQSNLDNETWAERFRLLSEENKSRFLLLLNENKEKYYTHRNDNAELFKSSLVEIKDIFPDLFRNVNNLKKIIDSIFKIQKYQKSIKKIDEEENNFKSVKYDARYNNDKLEAMRISHDTLLEYTQKIVEENDLLKQIVCDKYPFILVDEYQDTDPKVIKTLSAISQHSKSIQHNFFVGYYGDIKQQIYDSGVGYEFFEIHGGLERIVKTFNRRSANSIINIANKIRNDELEQESIYTDNHEGTVAFYNIDINHQEFIDYHIKKWNITKDNKLHCFELTNELVAKESGFERIYDFFKNSPWYKGGLNFRYLRDHVLSLDTKKLGIVQNLLFKILNFRYKINCNETAITDVLYEKVISDINSLELKELVYRLRNTIGDTLKEYIISMFSQYGKGDYKYDKCIENFVGDGIKSYDDIEEFVLNQLYNFNGQNEQDIDGVQSNKEIVRGFFEIDINVFSLWHNFIIDKSENEVIYHTFHGTKGREFENVVIFLNQSFGRDLEYFSNLLKVLTENNEFEEQNTKIEEARNLLYVAVTRAIRNLSIVYPGDISNFKTQIEHVFGEIMYNI